MEKLLESGSVGGLLAGVVVLLALQLFAKIGEVVLKSREKKDEITESGIEKLSAALQQNTFASEKLEHRMKAVEHSISDVTKMKLDMGRLYTAVKLIAGDRWPAMRKIIMDDPCE